MDQIKRYIIPVKRDRVRSLCWHGNELIDWATGGNRYQLDGTITESRVYWGYKFDNAVTSPDGRYAVIYETLGTKAVILKEGKILREINRSYYFADVYEYPVTLMCLRNGSIALAHCPDEYCKIELEEIETGQRLTARANKPADFFHSRLQVSSDGRFILSAGWYWRPFDRIEVYEIETALANPETLDQIWQMKLDGVEGEIHSAAFNGNDELIFTADAQIDQSPVIGRYSLEEKRVTSLSPVNETIGNLMPVGDFAVAFYGRPKLVELKTGQVIRSWDDINTGNQNSSIIGHQEQAPPLALDPVNRRFAVAGVEAIVVVQLD
jgi:hypothetical protein